MAAPSSADGARDAANESSRDAANDATVESPPTLITQVPGFPARDVAAEPTPAVVEIEFAVEPVPSLTKPPVGPAASEAVSPVEGPVGAPPLDTEFDDDATRLTAPPLPTTFTLQGDDGEPLVVAGTTLIGRNPAAGPDETIDTLLAVDDEAKSLSKTHALLVVEAGRLLVSDRHSTNGTRLRHPLGDTEQVGDEPVAVAAGDVLQLGDRSFTVGVR